MHTWQLVNVIMTSIFLKRVIMNNSKGQPSASSNPFSPLLTKQVVVGEFSGSIPSQFRLHDEQRQYHRVYRPSSSLARFHHRSESLLHKIKLHQQGSQSHLRLRAPRRTTSVSPTRLRFPTRHSQRQAAIQSSWFLHSRPVIESSEMFRGRHIEHRILVLTHSTSRSGS